MAKSKYRYKVYRPNSSSVYFQGNLWDVLRDIAYAFKEGHAETFTITREKI